MAGSSSSFVLIAFLSLTLFACITGARTNPTNNVQANPKDSDSKHGNGLFYHDGDVAEPFKKDFELERPIISIYPTHGYRTDSKKRVDGDHYGELFKRDFELERPTVLVYPPHGYGTDSKKRVDGDHYGHELFKKYFELERPTVLVYPPHGYGTDSKKKVDGDHGELFTDFELDRPSDLLNYPYEETAKPKEEKPLIKLFSKDI